MHPKVSVVIPTYNLKNILIECLESIVKQSYPVYEIIVIDNASSDGTYETVKKKFPNAKLFKNKKNLGVTAANQGVKIAKGDYVWFVDHDNIFNRSALSEMVELGESNSKIGVIHPKIYYFENKDIIWSAGGGQDIIMGFNIFRGGKDVGQYEKIEEIDVATANFLVKKEVIKKIGAYDTVFGTSYEDTDFSFRVRKAGYKIVYTPKAVCYHKIPLLNKKTSKQRWLSRAYFTSRNKIIFMRKHSPFFLLFVFMYPVWFTIYTSQAIRYRDLSALRNFYKGMLDGFSWAFFSYKST